MTITNKKREVRVFYSRHLHVPFFVKSLVSHSLAIIDISRLQNIKNKQSNDIYYISQWEKNKYSFIYYLIDALIFFKQSGKFYRNLSSRK